MHDIGIDGKSDPFLCISQHVLDGIETQSITSEDAYKVGNCKVGMIGEDIACHQLRTIHHGITLTLHAPKGTS